jgi:hypothetical protein
VEQELAEVTQAHDQAILGHTTLFGVITLVCYEHQVAQPAGENMLAAHVGQIPHWVCELERGILLGVKRVFAIARSHYVNINLKALSLGYPDNYSNVELDALEASITPLL